MGDVAKVVIGGVVIGALIYATGGAVLGISAASGGSFLGVTGVAGAALAGGVLAGVFALLKPKLPTLSNEFGREIALSGDPVAPRKVIYGEAWTAGVLRFRAASGADNKELHLVIILASHSVDDVPE
ncbi:hypothetical protein BH24PSE2_BH24PSE2_21910 [soil metagenome]